MSKRIEKNLVLKGLEITLELTIGNFDQDFVDNWYTNLKHFFHCLNETDSGMLWQNRTENTKKIINETERILKQQLKKEDYEEIKNTITSSKTTTKRFLQQLKFKKFTSLKHKPKSAVKTVVDNNERSGTTEEQPRPAKPSYAQALKSNTNTLEKKIQQTTTKTNPART